MKFSMNGYILIRTLDRADVDSRQQVSVKNFFLFGVVNCLGAIRLKVLFCFYEYVILVGFLL